MRARRGAEIARFHPRNRLSDKRARNCVARRKKVARGKEISKFETKKMRARTHTYSCARDFCMGNRFSQPRNGKEGRPKRKLFSAFSRISVGHIIILRAKSDSPKALQNPKIFFYWLLHPIHDPKTRGRPLPLPLLLHGQPWCARACPSIRALACTPSLPPYVGKGGGRGGDIVRLTFPLVSPPP